MSADENRKGQGEKGGGSGGKVGTDRWHSGRMADRFLEIVERERAEKWARGGKKKLKPGEKNVRGKFPKAERQAQLF